MFLWVRSYPLAMMSEPPLRATEAELVRLAQAAFVIADVSEMVSRRPLDASTAPERRLQGQVQDAAERGKVAAQSRDVALLELKQAINTTPKNQVEVERTILTLVASSADLLREARRISEL